MRVYELAKELDLPTRDVVVKCQAIGLKVANNFSGLSDDDVVRVRAALGRPKVVLPTPPPPKPPAPAKPSPAPPSVEQRRHAPPASAGAAPGAPPARKPGGPPPAYGVAPKKEEEADRAKGAAAKGRRVERRVGAQEGAQGLHRIVGEYADPDSEVASVFAPPPPRDGLIHATPLQFAQRKRGPRQRKREGKWPKRQVSGVAPKPSEFSVHTPISIKDLSASVGIKAGQIIAKLMQLGLMLTINSVLEADQVDLIAQEFHLTIHTAPRPSAESALETLDEKADAPEDLKPRPPVVAFLGHVDHGKTSLLDRIRKSDVAAHEHGGITQHIGAYRVTIGERTVVFLDTPGHEAFTAMRARGANVTDIVTLVVAADDGVMPQTEEAIDHARAAGAPIVVALNKCDKPEANPNMVKQQLAKLGLSPEEWGGDTVCVEVSAVTGKGVDDLVEMLSIVAELRELKANPARPARGTVLEAQMSGSQGPMAMVLVQNGTLRVGDDVVAGCTFGRVKALLDERGRRQREAGPSTPIAMLGLNAVPAAGDKLMVLREPGQARAIAEERDLKSRQSAVLQREHVTLENLFASIEAGRVQELRLILKADGRGTLDALDQVLGSIPSNEVKIRRLHSSVGAVSTSDVLLADASDAVIVGLNVAVDTSARALAEQKGVSIRVYNVIYRVKEEIERALAGMLAPEEREVIGGHAEVRRVFRISRYGAVAGCFVRSGTIARSHRVRLIRDGAVVHDGRLASLRREKDDVREVREGFECGILLEAYDDIKEGDVIESYQIEKIARTLEAGGASSSA